MRGFGVARRVGLVAILAALIALMLGKAPLGAEPESRREGRIAFTFGESGALRPAQLAVMDADGKNKRALPPYDVIGVSWSPDGRSIAFGSLGNYGISTIDVDVRSRSRRIVRNANEPDWSPNGRSIAFERGRGVWVVNVNGRRQRRIVRNGSLPRWAPDGKKLMFERRADLWVLDVAAKKERLLVRNAGFADWSPDGRRIVFQRWRKRGGDFESFIYVMRADGTAQRRLFAGEQPVWSPNGKELAFIGVAARRHFQDAVIRTHLDGSGRRVLFGQRPYCGCGALDWARAI